MATATLRETKPVYCWPIVTGEDLPDTDPASLARVLAVPFSWTAGSPHAKLAEAQEASAHLCAVGEAWLTWLEGKAGRDAVTDKAKKFSETRESWAETLRQHRQDMANPLRVATNLTINQLTWQVMEQHPTIGPVVTDLTQAHRQGLEMLASEMGDGTTEALEARRYLLTLRELLATERHLLLKSTETISFDSQRDRVIGWKLDDETIALLPVLARQAVDLALGPHALGDISESTLYTQLESLGYLASRDKDHRTKKMRIGADGQARRVLHLCAKAMWDEGDAGD